MNPNRDVVELWGREFNIVKSGLSEAQVVSFVNDLVKQHDMLLQRQEHLATLTKLAERTVTEAEKLADETKREAADQAKAEAAKILADAEGHAKDEAARIITEAEARAQQIFKEKEAEVMAAATEQAEAIKSDAEAQARAEAARIVAEAQARGQQIVRDKENEATALATEQAKAIREQAEHEAEQLLEHEKEKIQPELNIFVRRLHGQLLTELEHLKQQVGAFETDYAQAISQSPDGSRPVDSGEKRDDFLEFVRNLDEAESGEPEWDLEVLPPIDIMKIMSIVGYLDNLPEVEKTEIIPRNERTSIIVFLRQPLEVVEVIKTLPEVAEAEEDTAGADSKPRKVNLILSSKTGSGEDNEGVGKTSRPLSS
jgi:F0F1-type ATP synthase membrane subunit b/b'